MLTLLRRGLQPFILAAALLLSTPNSQAQEKQAAPGPLKIGFLMDSLKVERWQTDLEKFQKRAAELGAEALVETAEGDDELQLHHAQKLLSPSATPLLLMPPNPDRPAPVTST